MGRICRGTCFLGLRGVFTNDRLSVDRSYLAQPEQRDPRSMRWCYIQGWDWLKRLYMRRRPPIHIVGITSLHCPYPNIVLSGSIAISTDSANTTTRCGLKAARRNASRHSNGDYVCRIRETAEWLFSPGPPIRSGVFADYGIHPTNNRARLNLPPSCGPRVPKICGIHVFGSFLRTLVVSDLLTSFRRTWSGVGADPRVPRRHAAHKPSMTFIGIDRIPRTFREL